MKTNRLMDEIRSTISPEMKMQMEMSVAIANRIYEILDAKGMTQKEWSTAAGHAKNGQTVSRIISKSDCRLSTFLRLLKAVDCRLEIVEENNGMD